MSHLQEMQRNHPSELRYAAPLLLAIKALVSVCSDSKIEILKSKNDLETIFGVVYRGINKKEFKNVYTSGLLLMCEIEYNEKDMRVLKFDKIIEDQIN
jgi:hypothetical protein